MSLHTSAATRVSSRVSSGANVTVLPGTAIGFRFDSTIGFDFWEGSTFTSEGTPTRPISYAPVSLVQEGPFPPLAPWAMPGYLISFLPDYWPNEAEDPPPVITFRFSNSSLNSGLSHHFLAGQPLWFFQGLDTGWTICSAAYLNLRDCQFNSGWWSLGEPNSRLIYPAAWGGPVIPGSVSLFNNSFNRVAISLDPDTGPVYWYGPYDEVTMDIRLTATNNTFRGGWLFLEQVPATAEGDQNWVFRYNLFDKVAFAQQPERALHFDYNAYWPCRPSTDPDPELLVGQTPKLSPPSINGSPDGDPDGDHDFEIGAPPYRIGPLGSFYLEPGSALQDAADITAAQVGLWHYTTRENQDKEGDLGTGVLDIGVHYVALDLATGLPKDSDSPTADGIPDYVENWHGDGDFNANETDWQHDNSTVGPDGITFVEDKFSPVYDEVDLDGDGMVGRIEKMLSIEIDVSPLVSDNPLILQAATGDWPEFRKFKLPIDHDFLTANASVCLSLAIGTEAEIQGVVKDTSDGSTLLVWNTTFDAPGQYFLQPRIFLNAPAAEGGAVTAAAATGPLLPFETDNALQFESLDSTFDDSGLTLYARTHPGTVYSIELKDATGAHLNTISDTVPVDSSEINVTWDLKRDDTGQTLYTGNTVVAAFTVTPPGAPQQTRNFHASRSALGYGDGFFTLAYQWDRWTGKGNPLDQCFQSSVADVLLTPRAGVDNYSSIYNDYTPLYSVYEQWGGAGHTPNAGRKEELLTELGRKGPETPTRNFYWYGHGMPSYLGDTRFVTIEREDVATRLGNDFEIIDPIPEGLPIPVIHRDHPYRFVLLDGCVTAHTPLWAEAFGMPGKVIDYATIARKPERAQAFLGWRLLAAAPVSEQEVGDKQETLGFFFGLWMSDQFTLEECMEACRNFGHPGAPYEIIPIDIKFPMGAYRHGANSALEVTFRNEKFYGYPRITRSRIR